MSKLYAKIEQIFRFRLLSNSDIDDYIKRMSNMGKLDEVRKNDLLRLILTRLGEIEDEKDMQYIQPREGLKLEILDPTSHPSPTNEAPFKCPDCPMVAKSKLGLMSHSRKHKK